MSLLQIRAGVLTGMVELGRFTRSLWLNMVQEEELELELEHTGLGWRCGAEADNVIATEDEPQGRKPGATLCDVSWS